MALKVKTVGTDLVIYDDDLKRIPNELLYLEQHEVDNLISELRKFQTPTRLESPVEGSSARKTFSKPTPA